MADDHQFAADLARQSGRLLVRLRNAIGFEDAPRLRTEGDRQSHLALLGRLATERPEDAVLSEEALDDPVRLKSSRVWIVDPLDGTREYAEAGRTDWAVHVALWDEGELTAGAVAIPAVGKVFSTSAPPDVAPGDGNGPVRLVVSRSRPPGFVEALAASLGAEPVPMGSAGAKAMAVIDGQADAYVHAGGQYEWDSAAPVAVARAAGLYTSRLDGSPLRYNQPDPHLPDLVICRQEVVSTLFNALVPLAHAASERP